MPAPEGSPRLAAFASDSGSVIPSHQVSTLRVELEALSGLPELAIRRAALEDAPRLNEIEIATFDVHRIPLRAFRRLIGTPSALMLVCDRAHNKLSSAPSRSAAPIPDAAGVLGYACVLFRQGSRRARLYSLAVSQDTRNAGIGSRLLCAVMENAEQRGLQWLSLEVRAADESARRFYQRFGFTLKDELPCYYDDGADAVRLVRRVDRAKEQPSATNSRSTL